MRQPQGRHERTSDRPKARRTRNRPLWTLSMASVLLLLPGCFQTDLDPVGSAPVISAFSADPQVASAGAEVTLSWNVTGADMLTLMTDDVDVSGSSSITLVPAATTTYTLIAENGFGTSNRSIEVVVEPAALGAPSITGFESQPSTVTLGSSSTLSWTVAGADAMRLEPLGIDVSGTTSRVVTPSSTTTYRLTATNEAGSVSRSVTVEVAEPPPPGGRAFSVLVVGQSNAQGVNLGDPNEVRAYIDAADGVSMFGNDYVWKPAYEPLDDCVGQVDQVSVDPSGGCESFEDNGSGVSFGVSLGNELAARTGDDVFLIPAARGGSSLLDWSLGLGTEDQATLFGSAVVRGKRAGSDRGAPLGRVAGGDAYGAVVWFQGETDTASSSLANAYARKTEEVLDGFVGALEAPIILVQLARRGYVTRSDSTSRNLLYQVVREQQRRLADGARLADTTGSSSPISRSGTHLVVTHDLPMADGRHLSAAGQVEVGRRVSLAIREHLWGEAVDGSGPRLARVDKPSTSAVWVHADRPVTPPATTSADAYSGYFAVFSEGVRLPIESIVRHEVDARVIVITFGASVSGAVEVRYMPPPVATSVTGFVADVVRSDTCTDPMPGNGTCLPMAAFGAVAEAATLERLERFSEEGVDE